LTLLVKKRKVREYLLSRSHPIGRLKAAFFGTLGFELESLPDLRAALQAHALAGEVVDREATPYGTKYVVEGVLRGPRRSALVRSVWIHEGSGPVLRLITAYPASREANDD
jgi:hypothetical protein